MTVSCSFPFTGKASRWKAKFARGNCVCLLPVTKNSEIDYNVLPTIAWRKSQAGCWEKKSFRRKGEALARAGGRFCRPCGRIPPCSFQMGLRRLSLHCWQPVLHRRDGDGFLLHHAGLHRRMSSCRLHPSRSLRVSLQATAKGSKQKTEEIKYRIIRNTVSRDLSTPTAHCAHTAFGGLTSQR